MDSQALTTCTMVALMDENVGSATAPTGGRRGRLPYILASSPRNRKASRKEPNSPRSFTFKPLEWHSFMAISKKLEL